MNYFLFRLKTSESILLNSDHITSICPYSDSHSGLCVSLTDGQSFDIDDTVENIMELISKTNTIQ